MQNFKKKPKTNAEYKATERDKKRKTGLIRVEFWIRPEWKVAVKEFIESLGAKK